MPDTFSALAACEIFQAAVQRAFVQMAELPARLLPSLIRVIRRAVTDAMIEAASLSELPELLEVLLDDLLTDRSISAYQRVRVLTFVTDELRLQLGSDSPDDD
ncbi:hypothetical protein [Deinococcus sp.]|uniref:hypothetical protein n=1 Tax=Deinococcus sp. TaxID=47478 RepID=UPI003C7A2FF9